MQVETIAYVLAFGTVEVYRYTIETGKTECCVNGFNNTNSTLWVSPNVTFTGKIYLLTNAYQNVPWGGLKPVTSIFHII